jgi:hypothetical protein
MEWQFLIVWEFDFILNLLFELNFLNSHIVSANFYTVKLKVNRLSELLPYEK